MFRIQTLLSPLLFLSLVSWAHSDEGTVAFIHVPGAKCFKGSEKIRVQATEADLDGVVRFMSYRVDTSTIKVTSPRALLERVVAEATQRMAEKLTGEALIAEHCDLNIDSSKNGIPQRCTPVMGVDAAPTADPTYWMANWRSIGCQISIQCPLPLKEVPGQYLAENLPARIACLKQWRGQ